ncbi:unnamed protein product [Cyprideis torosa]|uniref:5-amino-6-(5-phosphoribosylamino)uracil reductase n=1 Tax=Cyprideis torosa TaxID=163714 RepID=A0A7R8ZVS4_9CRUS|nr:unnamed protein product [Cyprideis torosa]CAG0910582.1 unnamed protein product [Cyprideis torosa]
MAMSLDGRTAMSNGDSAWITSADARQDVQHWRARSSAILSGVDTVIYDDPSLNVRMDNPQQRQPLRVIVDSSLRTPLTAKTLSLPGEVVVVHVNSAASEKRHALQSRGVRLVGVAGTSRVDLADMLKQLAVEGINEVHVEAGATLCGALLAEGLVDELVIYMAPILMGDGGRGLFHLPEIEMMSQRKRLKIVDIRAVGEDWRMIAQPVNEE